MKQFIAIALFSALLTSCGSGRVTLSQPADGQTFTMPQGGGMGGSYSMVSFMGTTDDNNYDDVVIQARGSEKVPGLQCNGGSGVPLQCVLYPQQNSMGMMQGQTYVVAVTATRGDWKDIRLVFFQNGQAMGTPGAPPR